MNENTKTTNGPTKRNIHEVTVYLDFNGTYTKAKALAVLAGMDMLKADALWEFASWELITQCGGYITAKVLIFVEVDTKGEAKDSVEAGLRAEAQGNEAFRLATTRIRAT